MVTRSVRDSAAILDATAGPDNGAPYYPPSPLRPFLKEVGQNPGSLKIGMAVNAPSGSEVHKDCVNAVKESGLLLESLGHVVEEVVFPGLDEQLTDGFMIILTTSLAWEIDAWSRKIGKTPTKDDFEPATWALFEIGKQNTATHYVDAISNIHQFSRNFANKFIGYDILVTPTLAEPPLVLGSLDPTNDDPLAGFQTICNLYSLYTDLQYDGTTGHVGTTVLEQ